MPRLQLAPHMVAAFDAAMPLLAAGLPEQHLVLSGGSILQALWRHRTSTDLDFFLPSLVFGKDEKLGRSLMNVAAQALRSKGHIVDVVDMNGMTGRLIDGIRFSVGVAHWMHLEFGRDRIRQSKAQAATVEEVFIGKLHGRFKHGRQSDGAIPIRDLYDMTVCMRHQPDILEHHFRNLMGNQIRDYADRLRRLPDDWHLLDEDKILEPTYAVDLRGIAQTFASAVEQRNAYLIPIAKPVRSSDDDGAADSGR